MTAELYLTVELVGSAQSTNPELLVEGRLRPNCCTYVVDYSRLALFRQVVIKANIDAVTYPYAKIAGLRLRIGSLQVRVRATLQPTIEPLGPMGILGSIAFNM